MQKKTFRQQYWSTAEAVAWVAFRSPDKLIDSLCSLSTAAIDQAASDLWRALLSGEIAATGRPRGVKQTTIRKLGSLAPGWAGPEFVTWGAREIIPSFAWLDMRFTAAAPYLLGEDASLRRYDDVLVAARDVLAQWPEVATPDLADVHFRTGCPGRPSPIQLIEDEAGRRRADGEAESTVSEEANKLRAWAIRQFPKTVIPTAKTIENRIREPHRAWKAARKNPHN